jgi:thioredoxin 1
MKNRSRSIRMMAVIIMAVGLFSLVGTPAIQAATSAKAARAKTPAKTAPAPQSLPRLVDVGADKCVPCVAMAPILENLKNEYEGIIDVKFVDVWKYPEEAQKYQVRGIPTQIFYDASGKELGRHMGFIDKDGILEGFKHFGVTIEKPSGKQASRAQ